MGCELRYVFQVLQAILLSARTQQASLTYFCLQGVHMVFTGRFTTPWEEGEKKESKFVFIGRDLPKEELTQGFLSCVVPNGGNLRFDIGTAVYANCGQWKRGKVMKHWNEGNAYRVRLDDGAPGADGEVWAPIDLDGYVQLASAWDNEEVEFEDVTGQ